MTGRRWQFVLLLAASLTASALRAAELSPWDEWRLGYTSFEIGEQKRSRGDYTAALAAFEKSRGHYLAVKRSRPDWNQKVIRERLAACDRQIAELRRLLGDKAPAPKGGGAEQKGGSSVGRRETPSATVSDDVIQLRKLRAELAEAKAELEELRNERARRGNYETEIANLLRDRKIAREKYALLEKRCQKLQEELKKPESALQELRRQLVEKNERLADAEKSIRLLEERLRRGERGAMENNREKTLLRSQLRQAGEAQQRLRNEIETLSASIDAERGRLGRAQARIAELEKALREAEKTFGAKKSSDGNASVNQEELARLRNIAAAAEKRADQFQKQCVELRGECDTLIRKLQAVERSRAQSEADVAALRAEADRQRARAESLADELANVRELQRKQEEELKRTLAEIEPLRARLARRDSEDFKGMVEARDAMRKLEAEITKLKTREAEVTVALAEEKKAAEALRRELNILRGEVRKAKARQKGAEQELESIRGDAEKYRELLTKYQRLESNFEALRRENQENRAKLAAASPREAELRRIKLRLVELNQLKDSLGKEQRLNSELLAEKKRLQEEVRILREKSSQLSDARKQLEALKALQLEVAELRRVNRDAVARLEKMKNLEGELVAAKRALIESGAAQLELLEVKQAYAKAVAERNAAASEAARLRDRLAAKSRSRSTADTKRAGAEQELEKTRQELKTAREKLAQMDALVKQLEQLRKLNDELMYARSFEAELVKARTALGELARYKEELAGVIRLNEQLVNEKNELEKELARRSGQDAEPDEQSRIILANSKDKPEDYIAEGMSAAADGNTELAIWNYRKALELDRNHPVAAERLGMLLLQREEFTEAAQLLSIARRSAPGRLDLALALSRAYLGVKRFGNAQAVVAPLLRSYPENGELLIVAALAAADGGDAARAEKYLKLAIRYLPKSPEPLIELSRLLVRHDSTRMEEAAKLYETARDMGAPPDIELEPALGPRLDKRRELEQFLASAMNEAFDNRDYFGAAWYCKQLLEINRRPRYFTPLLALARLLGGESGSARETLTFNAESAQGALVLALVELKDGNRTAFTAAVRRALALNKGKPVLINVEWRNLGLALDAAKVKDPAAGKELSRAYKWE